MTKNLVFFVLIFILFIIGSYFLQNYQVIREEFAKYKSEHHYGLPYQDSDIYTLTRKIHEEEVFRDKSLFSQKYRKNLYGGNYDVYDDDYDGFNFS